jgi:hypothetical protein
MVRGRVRRMLLSWVVLRGAGVRASHVVIVGGVAWCGGACVAYVVVGGVAWCGGACVACCCRGWCCMVQGCVRRMLLSWVVLHGAGVRAVLRG